MSLWQDVTYAFRTLGRARGFAAVAVLTLAVGIGANSAVFSLVDAVLLRPLPFADPDRLVDLYERRGAADGPVSGHEFAAWRDQPELFAGAAAYAPERFSVTGSGDATFARGMKVSANFFDVLGAGAARGRTFASGEDSAEAGRVAVLSDGFWRRRFGAAPVIGTDITLDNARYRIVGIMPRRDAFDPDVWVPIDLAAEIRRVGRHSLSVIARLKPGIPLSRAQKDLEVVALRLQRDYPDFNAGHGVRAIPLREDVVGGARRPVLVALAAVAFVLLIACANVAHLLLTRAAGRQRELALRAALGAGRWRLVRQLLAESGVISLIGGALGLLLAWWIVDLLPALKADAIPRLGDMTVDRRALAVTLGLSVVTALITGAVPALRSSQPRLVENLGQRGHDTNGAIGPIAGIMVVSQIAAALVLLIGAGLMLRSYVRLVHVDPGFDASHVLAVPVSLPALRYPAPLQRIAAIDAVLTRIRAVRGVQRAGATTQLPMAGGDNMIPITIEGQAAPPPNLAPAAALRVITPDYFRAMEIPLRQGRDFSSADARVALPLIRYFEQQPAPPRFADSQPAPVAIINETMARRFWDGADPIGQTVRILFSPPLTIVGVVGDVRHTGLSAAPRPEIYLPHVQEPQAVMTLAIRTEGDPTAVAAAVRQEIRSVDRNLPVEDMRRMEDLVAGSAASTRFDTLLLGTCGAVAVALALIGIYGVMAYSVARRAHEIGIRTALGAQRSDVLALVLRRALLLTTVGIAIGLAMAAALTRLMQSLLFAVSATDAATFAAVALALAGASLLASYLPARAALRMDPLEALRSM